MIKNIIKVLLSNFIVTAIGLVNSFVLPKIMDISDYAFYHTFLLYLSYIAILHIGIPTGMFINYGGKDYKKIKKDIYKSEILLLLSILSFFTIFTVIIYFIFRNQIIIYVSLAIIPVCINGTYKSLFQAWNRFTEYSFISVITTSSITLLAILYYFKFKILNGNIMIFIYLTIYLIICGWLIFKFFRFTYGVRTKPLLSPYNINTIKTGFLVMLGNYINVLLHVVDKQFINILYSQYSFAIYSFAMSTQNIMTLFITALAQPFYPKLANGDLNEEEYGFMKELLLIFGAFSGCAYFACSFLIKHYITRYTDSIEVIRIFFAVFPAMSIINVLYLNLYKVTKQIKQYIYTLILIFLVATGLNLIAVFLKGDYLGISLATMITYYVWLFYSKRHFKFIHFTIKDYLYLTGFFLIYFMSTSFINEVLGLIIYCILIAILNFSVYRQCLLYITRLIKSRFIKVSV